MYPQGSKLKMHFQGSLENGDVFCSSRLQGNAPFEFVVGNNEILPALEKRILTMAVGDRKTFCIPAEEAYGLYDETLKEKVPVTRIPNGFDLPVGQYVVFGTKEGPLRVKVESVADGIATFDYNHELAGQNLTYSIDLLGAMDGSSHIAQEQYYADAESGCACHGLGHHSHEEGCTCAH